MPYYPLTNFQIQKLLSKKNIDEKFFTSFGVEHIPKEIKKIVENKNVITNIYRIQACDSIMCGYFCIGFINFMLKGKSLPDCANLFSTNDYERNYKTILKYFQ